MGLKESLHPKKHKTYKRQGSTTKADKVLVAQFVANNAGDVTPAQTNALATVLRRGREVTKQLIEEAREKFLARSHRYVDIHLETTEKALAIGSDKSLEVAARASQWAIENISDEGTRIVEKSKAESNGNQIMIGVKIAGMITNG